jgi:hypothetical protein
VVVDLALQGGDGGLVGGDGPVGVGALCVGDGADHGDLAAGVGEDVLGGLADGAQEGLGGGCLGGFREVLVEAAEEALEGLHLVGVGDAGLVVEGLEVDLAGQRRGLGPGGQRGHLAGRKLVLGQIGESLIHVGCRRRRGLVADDEHRLEFLPGHRPAIIG